jgi:Na+-translocating ferredoxin:NAD+ oxidoreductase RnfC subunit
MRAEGIKFVQKTSPRVHPMKDGRRVPQHMLRKRLKVEDYESETPYDETPLKSSSVRILLKQHAGQPASPVVSVGDRVRAGQKIGDVPPAALGAAVHASIDGTIRSVSDSAIEIAN